MFGNYNGVFIIAEAGVNHNGDILLAKKLIDSAIEAGANCIKFQTWVTEDLVDVRAPKAAYQILNDGDTTNQYEMLKNLELSYDDFRELKSYTENKGIIFLSTPDEKRSLDFLVDELNLPFIKVGSGEVNNHLYLKQIALKKRPVILSTGMSNLEEVEKAYTLLLEFGCPEIAILHCTSEYPAPYDTVNLMAMNTLKNSFNTIVGYSDHTEGYEISLAAVALGAKIIEKHFTLDKNLKGPDHSSSLNPKELKELVDKIRNIEKSIGDGIKKASLNELETKKVVQKGLYTLRDLEIGHIISENDLVGKRPVIFESVLDYKQFIGKKITKSLKSNEAISLDNIK